MTSTTNPTALKQNSLKFMCNLKANLGLGWEDCQQAVIDEFMCMVTLLCKQMYVIECLQESQHGFPKVDTPLFATNANPL